MCVALDKELAVAGYLNTRPIEESFTVENIMHYVDSLWNAGCGPIRLNFTVPELQRFLESSSPVIQKKGDAFHLNTDSLQVDGFVREALKNDRYILSFALFSKLKAIINVPRILLDEMGYGFFFAESEASSA